MSFGPQLAFIGPVPGLPWHHLNGASGPFAYAPTSCFPAGRRGGPESRALPVSLPVCFPKHFFVYIFINGFLGAALTLVGVGSLISVVLAVAGAYSGITCSAIIFPISCCWDFPKPGYPGMVITLFVVYRPKLVLYF